MPSYFQNQFIANATFANSLARADGKKQNVTVKYGKYCKL